MRATLLELKRKVVAEQQSRRNSRELSLIDEGTAFMEQNAKQEGVVTTESGLQYRVLEPGNGRTPGPTDQVTVNYRGTLIDGKEFDSSFKRGKPATFQLDAVVKGWTEGLQLIREGGKIKLFVPPNLAYGRRGPLAHRTLIFDVDLISVDEQDEAGSGSQGRRCGRDQRKAVMPVCLAGAGRPATRRSRSLAGADRGGGAAPAGRSVAGRLRPCSGRQCRNGLGGRRRDGARACGAAPGRDLCVPDAPRDRARRSRRAARSAAWTWWPGSSMTRPTKDPRSASTLR